MRSIISDIAATAKAYTRAGVWDERLFRLLSGAVKEEMRAMPGEMISVRNLADIALAFSFMETRLAPKPVLLRILPMPPSLDCSRLDLGAASRKAQTVDPKPQDRFHSP